MAFSDEHDVMRVTQGVVTGLFSCLDCQLSSSEQVFPRLDYEHVMAVYGSDKPDLRFGMEVRVTNRKMSAG